MYDRFQKGTGGKEPDLLPEDRVVFWKHSVKQFISTLEVTTSRKSVSFSLAFKKKKNSILTGCNPFCITKLPTWTSFTSFIWRNCTSFCQMGTYMAIVDWAVNSVCWVCYRIWQTQAAAMKIYLRKKYNCSLLNSNGFHCLQNDLLYVIGVLGAMQELSQSSRPGNSFLII